MKSLLIEIIIGKYAISKDDDSVWITNTQTEEAGQFSETLFEEYVEKFWRDLY